MPHKDLAVRRAWSKAYYQRTKGTKDRKEYFKNWYKNNPTSSVASTKKWREANRFACVLIASRAVAKRLNYTPCQASKEVLAVAFTGFCNVCGRAETTKRLHMDHCHKTGQFRGWLCNFCNIGLGAIGDSLESVQQLLKYLQLAEAKTCETTKE